MLRYHNVYGPLGTYDGGREKAPAAICRKIAEAKINPLESIPTIVLAFNLFTSFDIEFTTLLKTLGFDKIVDIS